MTCVCILGRGTPKAKWFWRTRNYCLWPCSLAVPVLAGWVYAFCGSLEAKQAVALVLKRLRRRGKWLEVKWLEVSSDRLGELGIDDTFKRFLFSMHNLTIKYL